MKKGDIANLSQLVKTLKQLESKLEEDYEKQDSGSFNKSKNMMLKIQGQISKSLR